jgi:hypothetical protein
MTDVAVVWKVSFGALVLAFCALTVVLRKPAAPPIEVLAPPAAAAATATPPAPDIQADVQAPAPLDVQDESPPARIEVVLPKPKSLRKPAKHTVAAQMPPPRIHRVVATRAVAHAKPNRAHYPYDPRERWAWRERP